MKKVTVKESNMTRTAIRVAIYFSSYLMIMIASSQNVHACNPVTFYGCSPEYKIAAQDQ